jgi:HK97 family phage major capsid protein
MADEQISKLIARKNEIASEMAEKRATFEESDVETRDALLNDVEELGKEAEEIDNDIKEVEEVKEAFAKQEERMSLFKNVETEVIEERTKDMKSNILDTPEYREAWVESIKRNDITLVQKVLRDDPVYGMATTNDNVPVPTIWQSYVETAWYNYGKFSRLVSKTSIAGYLNIPFESSATGAVVHTEGADAPTEEEIVLGLIEIKPAMIKKWISMTDEVMAMTADDFMRYLADELVYRVVLKLDEGIINGALDTNGKGVVGIKNNANVLSVTKGLSFNVVNEGIADLVTFDNLTLALNPKTFFEGFMGLTDQIGRPIYQIAMDNTGKPQYYVNGIRCEFTQALPAYSSANANDVWAICGDFRAYRLNLPEGDMVRTLFDPYTMATQDKARMIGRIFAGGNVARLKHFVQFKVPASV